MEENASLRDRLTVVEGLRDGAMISAAGLAWFTGSQIVAGVIALAFAFSLYDDWREERDDNPLAAGTGETDGDMVSEEWQCPDCGEWNFIYHVSDDTAFCSVCSTGVRKDAEVPTRRREQSK